MVSGLVTSPYDHDRICSGDARLIRTALKSLTSSITPPEGTFGSLASQRGQSHGSVPGIIAETQRTQRILLLTNFSVSSASLWCSHALAWTNVPTLPTQLLTELWLG